MRWLLFFVVLLFGCTWGMPNPPEYRTDHGATCGKRCNYLYAYSTDYSRQDLKDCYLKCWEMEQGYYFFNK